MFFAGSGNGRVRGIFGSSMLAQVPPLGQVKALRREAAPMAIGDHPKLLKEIIVEG
jgi:hypothetical protein